MKLKIYILVCGGVCHPHPLNGFYQVSLIPRMCPFTLSISVNAVMSRDIAFIKLNESLQKWVATPTDQI